MIYNFLTLLNTHWLKIKKDVGKKYSYVYQWDYINMNGLETYPTSMIKGFMLFNMCSIDECYMTQTNSTFWAEIWTKKTAHTLKSAQKMHKGQATSISSDQQVSYTVSMYPNGIHEKT